VTRASKLVLINEERINHLSQRPLFSDSKTSSRSIIYIDEYKLLDYKSDLLIDSNIKQSSKNASLGTLKVIAFSISLISLFQGLLYVFIIPNSLTWMNKLGAFFIIFGWSILFNSIFFMPGIIRIIASYLNEALIAYRYL